MSDTHIAAVADAALLAGRDTGAGAGVITTLEGRAGSNGLPGGAAPSIGECASGVARPPAPMEPIAASAAPKRAATRAPCDSTGTCLSILSPLQLRRPGAPNEPIRSAAFSREVMRAT